MKFVLRPENEYPGAHLIDGIGCTVPFRRFEINPSGEVTICCGGWLPVTCGNLLTDTYDEIFYNTARISVLENMTKGKITECNDRCTMLGEVLGCSSSTTDGNNQKIFVTADGTKKTVPSLFSAEHVQEEVNKIPYVIFFTYDRSCNLSCPSCRNELSIYKLNQNTQIAELHEKATGFVDYLLAKGEKVNISITGSGDPFGSPTFRNYLKELAKKPVHENLGLLLVTNGVLMTEQFLNEIKPLWPIIKDLTVSIDAATEETYNIVRRNGNFTKLKENLNNLDNLIDTGQIPNLKKGFITFYVVQSANYREIKEYAEWQLSYKYSNCIQFAMIARWDHMSDEQYEEMIDIDHDELRKIVKDPIFQNYRISLGNLSYYLVS